MSPMQLELQPDADNAYLKSAVATSLRTSDATLSAATTATSGIKSVLDGYG